MLDKIEYRIANRLAGRHFYPYGQDNYINIFRKFSHFPLKLSDINLRGEGSTITFIALVIHKCFDQKHEEFIDFYNGVQNVMNEQVAKYCTQDITVETLLGCIIYYYHPAQTRNRLSTINLTIYFDESHMYEFNLKKENILMYTVLDL